MEQLAAWLEAWEAALDPRYPERARPPAKVLGYGEISTVMVIDHPDLVHFAVKRMPMFRSEAEVRAYAALHETYLTHLARAGIQVPETHLVPVPRGERGWAVYILQRRVPTQSLAHRLIHHLSLEEGLRLARAVLDATRRVFAYNAQNPEGVAVGFDAQIANWAVGNVSANTGGLPSSPALLYLDTSTPLLRRQGREQLNPELFLRSAPSFLVWIMRLLFLEEVINRYYDLRQVVLDVIANLYKEKRGEWVPALVDAVNRWREAWPEFKGAAFTVQEVRRYYRQDAFIWRFYLAARKLDRWLHHLVGKEYPYMLPAKIER